MVKNLPANAGDIRDVGLIPGLGRSPGVGNGNPLQYTCLENPMDRRDWRATVHGVAESDMTEHACTHTHTHTHIHTHYRVDKWDALRNVKRVQLCLVSILTEHRRIFT